MKHPAFVTCLLSFVLSAPFAMADTVEVAGRIWTLGSGATLDGTVATFHVDGVERRSSTATTEVDLSPFVEGGAVEWRIRARGLDIAKPEKGWLGLKAMLSFKDGTGAMKYPGPGSKNGTFGWYTLRYRTTLTNGASGTATFMVGLQETNGEASFDLASLQFFPSPLEWPADDPAYQCEYTNDGGAVRQMTNDGNSSLPPPGDPSLHGGDVPVIAAGGGPSLHHAAALRGFMLPSRGLHDEDFAKLASWGVTLVRYQMNRNWNFADTERDLADYDAWMKVKLDHLEERVVPFAAKYGIKVVVDLHMPPGGRSADHEMNMFYEPEYADHYVETWRGIARRFKGAPSIVAYDLVNEPHQTYHAAEGNDCLSLQMRAAKAIREIDPDIPVIVEPIHNASPEGFKTLRALPMKNVIYQVHVYQPFAYTHQGINTAKPWEKGKWPDPEKGWDKDFLREKLAPVRDFQLRHGARIYVGEFSCIAWAEGAGNYLRDCISLFEEYGWDWTFHAYDEFPGWSIEHEADVPFELRPSEDNPRRRALLEGLKGGTAAWTLPPGARIEGNRLFVEIPADTPPEARKAHCVLPLDLTRELADGHGALVSVRVSAEGVSKPDLPWNGVKCMLHFIEAETGTARWPGAGLPRVEAFTNLLAQTRIGPLDLNGLPADNRAELILGLEGCTGRAVFDLSTLRVESEDLGIPRVNDDYIVRYPNENLKPQSGDLKAQGADLKPEGQLNAAQGHRPLRGFMLPGRPTTERDIADIAAMGATLVRFQITRNWSKVDDNQDLDEYRRWIDWRVDNLVQVLDWASQYGLKVCIDLHQPPGGKRGRGGHPFEMNMFHDARYADEFVATWRRIASRVKGHPAIYGYDLINEPAQHGAARFSYWELQRRAAEAVREIDPDTPIIVESNLADRARTFSYLSPLAMDNVIYQAHMYEPTLFTHQGIYDNVTSDNGKPLSWPGEWRGEKWDKEFIRRELQPVIDFQRRHKCRIYIGEFSAAAWAPGAENYLRDCISLFEEYGWDWTYHAFREAPVWDVDKEGPDGDHMVPAKEETPRKRALIDGFRGGM